LETVVAGAQAVLERVASAGWRWHLLRMCALTAVFAKEAVGLWPRLLLCVLVM